jgi:peptidoglycan/xylan/chitin deacetylase (PgdA/CDA1 family)
MSGNRKGVTGRAVRAVLALILLLIALPPLVSGLPYEPFSPSGNVLVLLYHTFGEEGEFKSDQYTLYTTAGKFERDISFLLESGLEPISLERFYRNDYDDSKRYFAVTVDDGYLTNYTVAYPIIKKLKCYMDIFANTDNFILSHHFSLEQAKEMEDSRRVRIYSHLPQHEKATGYSSEKLAGEIKRSFTQLVDGLHRKRLSFLAYPEGDYSEDTFKTAQESGVLLQMVQDVKFEDKELCVRTSVYYDTDMKKLLENAVFN